MMIKNLIQVDYSIFQYSKVKFILFIYPNGFTIRTWPLTLHLDKEELLESVIIYWQLQTFFNVENSKNSWGISFPGWIDMQ